MDTERLIKAVLAISCLTALEITALAMGVDGVLFSFVCIAIAGLGGYAIGKKNSKEEE